MIRRHVCMSTVSSLAVASVLTLAGHAAAQTPATPGATALPEVVVSASRSTENVQTIPAAVSALSGSDLEKKNVTQVSDLQYATPSLSITSAALTQNINIRGIGLASGSPSVVPGVPVYLDWLLQPPVVSTNSFFDIGQVEVYRGPQGTFAGASSTGGAVFITSNSPTFGGVNGNVEGWGGSYGDAGARGAVNLPVSDTLAARIAFNVERRDSFFKNQGGPSLPSGDSLSTPGKLDEQDLRLSLLWKPIENLSVLLKVEGDQKDTGGYDYRPIPGTPYAQYAPTDLRTLNFDQPEMNNEGALRNGLEIKYQLANGMTLRSVTGYQSNRVRDAYDIDASNGPPAQHEYQDVSERPLTQEFNLLSAPDSKVKWIVGAFYWSDGIKVGINSGAAGAPTSLITIITQKSSEAGFGRVQYDLTPALQLEVGARYTHDVVDNGGQVLVTLPGLPPLANIPLGGHWAGDNWTGKAALNYTLNDDNFLYVFASKGAKAGGSSGASSFASETVWAYEAGWKTKLFDKRVRLQVDGFYNDYTNFQVDALDVTNGNVNPTNTKGATIKGFEVQAQGRFGGLSFDAGAAYVDSSIGAVTLVNTRLLPTGGASNLGAQCPAGVASAPGCFNYTPYMVSVNGRENPYAPRWTYNIGAEYNVDLGNGATITPRLNYSYVGDQYTTLLENPTDYLRAHGVLNAQVSFAKGPYVLTAYATNLTNATYVSGQFINNEFLGPPRQAGIRASYRF